MKMPVPFLLPVAESVGLPEAHVAFLESFQMLENAPEGQTGLSQAWSKVTGASLEAGFCWVQARFLVHSNACAS